MKILDGNLEEAIYKVYGKKELSEISDSQLSILSYETKYVKRADGHIYREIYRREKLKACYLYQRK